MPLELARIKRQRPNEMRHVFGAPIFREAAAQHLTVSQLLEHIDPTDEYPANSPERQATAFERLMHAEGLLPYPIWERGLQAATWDDCHQTEQRKAMLLEFCLESYRAAIGLKPKNSMQRAIFQSSDTPPNTALLAVADRPGFEARDLALQATLNEIVARTTPIQGQNYRSVYITDDLNTDAYRLKRVNEAAEIPFTTMITGEHSARIVKYGRALRYTYEQLRQNTLDRIAFLVERMALQAEQDKIVDAMSTLINGDGNAGTAAPVTALTALDSAASAGTITLKGYINAKLTPGTGYSYNTAFMRPDTFLQIALLPLGTAGASPLIVADAGRLGGFEVSGWWQRQMADGMRIVLTTDAPALQTIFFDRSKALEQLVEIGATISERTRFITNQTEVLTMTETQGFTILDPYSYEIVNWNA